MRATAQLTCLMAILLLAGCDQSVNYSALDESSTCSAIGAGRSFGSRTAMKCYASIAANFAAAGPQPCRNARRRSRELSSRSA